MSHMLVEQYGTEKWAGLEKKKEDWIMRARGRQAHGVYSFKGQRR